MQNAEIMAAANDAAGIGLIKTTKESWRGNRKLIFRRGETEMPDKMSFEEMISLLDGACGRLIVASMASPVVREAKEMITKVSLSLGEWAEELEG